MQFQFYCYGDIFTDNQPSNHWYKVFEKFKSSVIMIHVISLKSEQMSWPYMRDKISRCAIV